MKDADKMREAFEAWRKNDFKRRSVFNEDGAGFPDPEQDEVYEAWQAATAQQDERIKDLEAEIEHYRAMLSARQH